MKIAILADIHGNLHALEAALAEIDRRAPDLTIMAGDCVNRGPRSRDCLERVLDRVEHRGWRVIRGNHEDYVLTEVQPQPGRPPWVANLCRHSAWTCEQIRPYWDTIDAWPHQLEVELPDGRLLRVVHASMRGNRAGLHESMKDEEFHPLIDPPPDALCVGHTHVPFVRQLHRTLVLNAGAVGMPFDRDHRASMAILEPLPGAWHAEIIRLGYDRLETERDYLRTGYWSDGGPLVPLILAELRGARPYLSHWHRNYEHRVASGELSVEDSVAEMMRAEGLPTDPIT